MEALMSHILKSAVTRVTTCDSPLDLSSNKYTGHTCDPLLNQEDLRHDVDATVKFEPHTDAAFVTSDTATDETESNGDGSGLSDDSIDVKREVITQSPPVQRPHPFSISSILGDSDDSSATDGESPEAVVFSAYVAQNFTSSLIDYHAYLYNFQQQQLSPNDAQVSDVTLLSPKFTTESYWCHVCNALCMDTDDAKRHQYFHRLQGATCSLRRSLFHVHGYVSRHVKLDEEKMQCGLCDKTVAHCFFTKHQRLHDGHFCDVCSKEFSTNSRLQDHMNVHSGSMPFSCTICDRKFAKRSSLTQHHRYHRDHNSFKCNYCSKSFNSKYARAVHERLHTGDNPFKCPMPGCSRAFPQKIQLKLHVRSHL